MKGRNLPIYRFKGDIIRKLRLSPDQKLRITFKDPEGNGFEIDDPQQIPTLEILQKRFPGVDEIEVIAYFNDIPIKDETIELNPEEPERKKIPEEKNQLSGEFAFIQQVMKQQDLLNELKFKNFVEITSVKIDGMKAQFEEMLKSKEQIYLERLELEREKVRLESGIESEGLLYKTLSKVLDEISPHIGDLAMAALEKIQTKKNEIPGKARL